MNIQRISAFSQDETGGNPAGVVIGEQMPPVPDMQAIAAQVGYSETAFAEPHQTGGWRVRYFSPQSEVPFCGHATIALGVALTRQFGAGTYRLHLNEAEISVEGSKSEGKFYAALQSPPTRSAQASSEVTEEVLELFGYTIDDIDKRIPPALVHGGADHFALVVNSRETLARMTYDLEKGKDLMNKHSWVTILVAYVEDQQTFHTRNAFASGGVLEDPATGASTAAFAGYLRDIGWHHANAIEIKQGFDMGSPSLLSASIPDEPGSSIRVSGAARLLAG